MPAPPIPTRCSRRPVHAIAARRYRGPLVAVSSTTAPRTLRVARELPNVAWALVVSRAIVWAFAILGQAALGYSFWRGRADPANLTAQLGDVGEVLGAPVMRWDSVYYVQIAQDGYTQRKQAGFFPLYPLLMDALDAVTRSTVIAGVLISVVAFAAGLKLFQRLARLETARDP